MAKKQTLNSARAGRVVPAFTLVELLVTIAIISLLLAVIMPAISRARDQANLTICKTRLRNVCMGALMYAQDNQSCLPVDNMLGPDFVNRLTGQLIENPHTPLIEALAQGDYLDNPENYYCPSQKIPEYNYSDENFAAGKIGYFYFSVENNPALNGALSTFLRWPEMGNIEYPRRLKDTMDRQTWVASDMWFGGQTTAHIGYKKGVNYAILDSSVQMVHNQPRTAFK